MANPKHRRPTPRPEAPAPRRPQKPQPVPTPPTPLLRTRFSPSQLLRRFEQLLPVSLLAAWLDRHDQTFYERAFTPLVTLWYLVFQRLGENHHLSQVVEDALAGGADRLSPPGKPLSRQVHSEATTSFSDARQRLPLAVCRQTLWHTAAQSAASIQVPQHFGLKVGLLDGSTCRCRPLGDIPQHFAAHPSNSKKPAYWCLARVVGILCLATGIALDSVMSATSTSEQALSARLLAARSWAGWLLLGDRNFGIYSVACAAVAAQAQVLLRLTEARARKLARSAGLKWGPDLDERFTWSASRHDQCPAGLAPTPIAGRLVVVRLERRGFRPLTLYLFTTLLDPLACPAQELAKLYGQRWKIEVCFRYIKAQMGLGFLECHSADMLHKEWLAGLIAYNLIRWTMAAAAALAEVPMPWLSFSRTRELLLGWCRRTSGQRRRLGSWKRLLGRIAKARLPKRRKPRSSEPRAIRPFHKDFAKLEGSRAVARQKLVEACTNS